jgi:autotransporter-associated beta strand protein
MKIINTIHALLCRSARRIISSLALAMLAGGAMLAAPCSAQIIGYFADPYITIYGGASGNPPALNIGNTFNVTGSGITVYQLGAFDWQGDGLATSHIVTLFSNQTAVASVTVPAGTAAPLNDGFRFAPLGTPVFLTAGQYAVFAYQMSSNDPYGDYNNSIPSDFNTGASVTRGGGIFDFVTSTNAYPTQSGGSYNFISASFTYIDSTGVWNGGGGDDNWSTSANWNNGSPTFPTILTFAGTAQLTNNNDLSGITLNGLTFDPAAGDFVLGGNDITLNGNIGFGANPATPVTESINLNMAWSASNLIIETPTNGTLNLDGNITSSVDTGLIKIDNGTLTLGGTNAILSWDLNGGTTTIRGNTTINGDGGRIYVGDGDYLNHCNGTLDIEPGAVLNITGSYGDTFVIGRDGGSGTVFQNGGTFTFNPGNNGTIWLGATGNSATRSEYDMNGGMLDMSGNTLGIGLGNGVLITGLVSQVSGVITNVGNLWVGWGNGHGDYTLRGGSIYIGSTGITTTSGNYAVNLGGGTVGAYANWSSSLNMNLTGSNGPVTFDTAANTITLSGTLSGTGGLTKVGSGTLDFSIANSYTGDTTINAGSLQFDAGGTSSSVLHIANGALLNLNYSGTRVVPGLYTNGVALPIGIYNSGNLGGFITGSGNLQVASSISTGLWTGLGADNNWSTAGNWDQNAVPVFPIGLTFAGSTQLTNNNDLSSITASSITFDSVAGAFDLNGNDITLSGNIGFNGNPGAPVTQTINLNMAWNPASLDVDTPTNGNLVLGGAITSSADYSLNKTGAGTLTLGGNNSIAGMGVNGGTNIITGTTTINGNGDGNDRFYLGDGDLLSGCNGTLVIQPGAVLGVTGSFGDTFVIGRDGGSGRVIQNGGTFTFNPASVIPIVVGATSQAGTRAEYDMNGGLLDMSGNALEIGLGDNGVTMTGVVNQVSGDIANVFELDLGAVRAYGRGIYTLSGGSITIDFGGIISDNGLYNINLGGGTVAASSSWTSSLNMNLTNLNGSVTFNPAGNTITLSGVLSGNGGLTVAGGGTLELSVANIYTGDTTVNASTLQLDVSGTSSSVLHLLNGGMLNLNYSGTRVVPGLYTNGVALPVGTYTSSNLGSFITGSGSLQVASNISTGFWTGLGADNNWSTAGNWDQNAVPVFPIGLTFAGRTQLVNNNDLSSITASSITFDAAAGAFVLGGNDITLNGKIGFNGNPAAPVTQTVNLNMAWSASETIDTPTNGNLTLGGAITSSSDTSLIKIDAGTLKLGGLNTILSWDLNGGTTTITGTTTINGDGGRIYVGDGDAVPGCNGTLVIQPGAALNVIGNYGDSFVIGRDSGSGTVIQNGGMFTFNCNQQDLWLGATGNSATRSEYDMNGGLLDMSGNTLGIGLGNGVLITGLVSQVSGVITNVGNLWVGWGNGHGVYTLSGGSIYIGTNGITSTSGNYAVNLGGGTVGAEANWASSLNMNLTNLNGSVTFNPAGNTITLSGVLSGNGGLTVAGAGTLNISGGYSYAGPTTVTAGTLQLDETGSSSGAVHIANGAVLNLNFTGTDVVAACYTNGVALPSGIYNSVNLPGFITGGGALQIAAATSPVVNHPVVSGGNVILTGSGGTAGAGYTWLTTTNLSAPITWTTNTTGNFDGSGDFSNAIPVSASKPAQFFRLRTP